MYLHRHLEEIFRSLTKEFAVIMVCGARHVGKSTMLKHLQEPDRKYVSFDDFNVRELAKEDPDYFFQKYGTKLIIDEFQKEQSILERIKMIVDE